MLPTFILSALFAATSVSAGKRGLAWPWYNNPLDPGVLNNGQGQVVAIYDWETYAPPTYKGGFGGLGFIGMQGCYDCSSSPLSQLQARWKQFGWATVFSINEPDNAATYYSPATIAQWYKTNINPLTIKKALPAITSDTSAGRGLDWLQQMINACAGGCYADYINLHWYGDNFSQFQTHVTNAHNKFPQYGVVITEFALRNPSGGQSAQVAFFRQAFAWLDAQSWVILYFPFVATSPSLLTSKGNGAASYVGTGSCLYTDAGGPSAVGNLMY